MKNNPRLVLWLIILLTALAVIIVMPKTKLLSINTPKLPGFNRSLSFTLPIAGSTIGSRQFSFREGLDLAGGTSITLKADMSKVPADQRVNALDGAKTVIERRVNLYGVSEPTIQTAQTNNDYRLLVELPQVNLNQAMQLIGTTAQLNFWEQTASKSAVAVQFLPLGIVQTLGPNATPTDLTGKDLKSAAVVFDPNTAKPQVQLQFTSDGSRKFASITERNVGKPLAIVLDNVVIEAPVVSVAIPNGNAVISGSFTQDTAKSLSIQLQAGALPIPLTVLQQQSIGATLGTASLNQSLLAGFIGLVVIVVFMMLLYGRFGFVASLALVLYTVFTLAIFKAIPITLTLAGIAGFVLSIGMAVDANILIFERTKEELRSGKGIKQSLELGFSRAWSSIRDSNISTLITSFILYEFGTGIVRGFALTLAIGVMISMFSAIVVTRTFLRVFFGH